MIGKKLLEEETLTDSEVKEILEKRVEEGEELNYEQRIALDYLQKFVSLSPEKSRELVRELEESSEKIKPEIATKIANLLPVTEDDVRAIFARERYALTKEEIDGILAIVSKYRK
jgi:DNA-directed RNA polymerase subunit F